MEQLLNLNPVLLAFMAGLFTWFTTALGSSMVFFFKELKKKTLNYMLGLAAGIMVAASFWSLLDPALELSESMSDMPWLMPALGFLAGGTVLFCIDKILPHLHMDSREGGLKSSWQRSILLTLAITLHNLPEGFAVGVAFGALAGHKDLTTLHSALTLMIGMGIQNFPEGAAVSIPLRREKLSRFKAFSIGQLSGAVEPIGAILGALSVMIVSSILPFVLSFAAGAMMYVVSDDLIPESQNSDHGEISNATSGFMVGFVLMMILDVALG